MTDASTPTSGRHGSLGARLNARFGSLLHEVAKFGVVGAVGAVVDIGLFNILLITVLQGRPLTAGTVSFLAAVSVTYVGNRFWTYRHRERTGYARETALFFVFNVLGLLIQLGILAFSTYVLDFKTLWAENISRNVIGLGVATLFRFWAYRRFVFPESVDPDADAASVTTL